MNKTTILKFSFVNHKNPLGDLQEIQQKPQSTGSGPKTSASGSSVLDKIYKLGFIVIKLP